MTDRGAHLELAAASAAIAVTFAAIVTIVGNAAAQTNPSRRDPLEAGPPVRDGGAGDGVATAPEGMNSADGGNAESRVARNRTEPGRLVRRPDGLPENTRLFADERARDDEECDWQPVQQGSEQGLVLFGNCATPGVSTVYQQAQGRSDRTPLTLQPFPSASNRDGCEGGRQWCRQARASDPDAYFLCVDLRDPALPNHFFLPPEGMESDGNIFLPNRRFVVAARYRGQERITAEIPEGQIGIEELRIVSPQLGSTTGRTTASPSFTPPPPDPQQCLVGSVYSVPSLRSGTARVTIKRGDQAVMTLPLVIDTVYAGAVRLGVGAIFGEAVSHQYNVVTAPGSGQREIGLAYSGGAEFELVVGASAFVWDLFSSRRGRTYVSPRPWWSYVLPSPFVGLGVVGTLGDKFTAFQSLHLGGEWEFTRSFTIGVTAVLRRTTRLNDGLVVGSPVSDSNVESSTHQELNWGLGLVVNFSPEFLQVMTPSTRSSSSGGN